MTHTLGDPLDLFVAIIRLYCLNYFNIVLEIL